MKGCLSALLLSVGLGQAASLAAQSVDAAVKAEMPSLIAEYKQLHQHPELSRHEEKTAIEFANQLRAAGYIVTEHVGRYDDNAPAYGVVGVLHNGTGKTVLIRAELDALPVVEQTGADYASKVRVRNASNVEVGVMHACGHDVHMTLVIGAARELAKRKDQWQGTVIILGQPAEELGEGARAMLADHLYERFGRPDFILGPHDTNNFAAGDLSVVSGPALSGETSIDVTMRGVGAHGSTPNEGKDPIVMSAEFIMALQTVVSRQTSARQPAVITIGNIHAGSKRNIIPDQSKMEMTLRSYDEQVNSDLVAGVKHTADGIAQTMNMPADLMPIVTVLEHHPVVFNDPGLSSTLQGVFGKTFSGGLKPGLPVMNSDDFGVLGMNQQIPSVMYWLGMTPATMYAESKRTGKPTPSPHSPFFLPDYEPTIHTGVLSLIVATQDLLPKK